MDDVWFDAELTRRDVETILRALALRENRPQPLFAVADRGGRLVLASRALFRFFDVPDAGALSARLLSGRDPGARRLASLTQSLAINGAPRLERLRFAVKGRPEVVTFLCRRISLDGRAPLLVAAALGMSERGVAAPEEVPAATADAPEPSAALPATLPTRDAVSRPLVGQALARSLDEASKAEAGKAEAGKAEASTVAASTIASRTEPPRVERPPQAWPSPPGPAELAERLRDRPGARRFSWQTDAALTCTRVGSALAEVVGAGNADLVGRNMAAVARSLDPSGRLAALLAQRSTFGDVALAWPVEGAAAAIAVELGGSPALTRDGAFDGFRGYGVIRPDAVVAHAPATLDGPLPPADMQTSGLQASGMQAEPSAEALPTDEPAAPADVPPPEGRTSPNGAAPVDRPPASGNVVAFPGALSAGDREAFDALGSELRDRVGSEGTAVAAAPATAEPAMAEPDAARAVVPPAERAMEEASVVPAATAEERAYPPAQSLRATEAARNGLAVLDRLQVALLVSRSNVPIFANRHLLDLTGFADEDELHEAGGLKHLFGGVPGNGSGGEVVGVRARDGSVAFTTARMQQIEWDGLPATLLTLKEGVPAAAPSAEAQPAAAQGSGVADGGEVRALRAVLETASDGIAVLDAGCNILSLNRSGEALIGRDRREVLGKPFAELFAADGRAADYLDELRRGAVQGAALGALNGGRELRVAGRAVPVLVTLGRLGQAEPGGEPEGAPRYCALFRDARPARADSPAPPLPGGERQDGEPSGGARLDALDGVASEVRPSLAAIVEAAESLAAERYGPLGSNRYREHVGDIRAAAAEIDVLLRDLLALSRAQAGRLDLASETVDVNRIVGEAVSAAQPRASRERVIMRLSLASNLPAVQADAATLRQIVGNLLGNALGFNEPGGQVIVASALGEDGGVAIRVRDTGPGLSEAEIDAALQPFAQGDASVRPVAGGSSLALPLAKALAEANGASLAIRSRLQQGTMIEVLFPRERVVAGSGAA